MTQLDLAEKLHYSDKAVSKWERGESVPEIGTLTAIADLFGVTLDYLVRADHDTVRVNPAPVVVDDRKRKNHALIAGMSVLLSGLLLFLPLFLPKYCSAAQSVIGLHLFSLCRCQ